MDGGGALLPVRRGSRDAAPSVRPNPLHFVGTGRPFLRVRCRRRSASWPRAKGRRPKWKACCRAYAPRSSELDGSWSRTDTPDIHGLIRDQHKRRTTDDGAREVLQESVARSRRHTGICPLSAGQRKQLTRRPAIRRKRTFSPLPLRLRHVGDACGDDTPQSRGLPS